MTSATVYTIKTTSGPIRAWNYEYQDEQMLVYPLEDLRPVMEARALPYDQYKGITRDDIRISERFPLVIPAAVIETLGEEVTAPDHLNRLQVVRIELCYFEGTGEKRIVETWEEADAILREWAEFAPDDDSYDKTDFTITWEGGATYTGRYDLKRHDAQYPVLLGRQVRKFALSHDPDFLTSLDVPEFTEAPPAPKKITVKQQPPAPKQPGGLTAILDNLQF